MRKSWLLCVFLGTLAWGQAQAPMTPPATRGSGWRRGEPARSRRPRGSAGECGGAYD